MFAALSDFQAFSSHSQWVGTRREERGVAVDGGERRGGMKQNNYQPVR